MIYPLLVMLVIVSCKSHVDVLLSQIDLISANELIISRGSSSSSPVGSLELTIGESVDLYSMISTEGTGDFSSTSVNWSISNNLGTVTVLLNGSKATITAVNQGDGFIEIEKDGVSKKVLLNVSVPPLEVGEVIFVKSIGGDDKDIIKGIVEKGSTLYFCGSTRGSYVVDGVAVDANTTQDEYMIGKLDLTSKNVQWINTAGKKEARSFCSEVDVDSVGNIYSVGTYYTDVNLGSGNLGSNGDRDIFIAKYNSLGSLSWARAYGGTAGEELNGMTILESDDVVTSGFFRATVDFGLGNKVSAGDSDAFVFGVNSSGITQFSNTYGLGGKDYYWDVANDSSDNIYATGEMIGNVDIGGGALSQIGGRDIFLGKYDFSGNHIWSMNFGVVGDEYTRNLTVNSTGEVFVAGQTKGSFNIGGAGHTNQGGTDLFLVKVDSSGTLSWARAFGSSANDTSEDVIHDSEGNIIIVATFSNTINVGGSDLTSHGGKDILVAKYDSNGNHIFSKNYGGVLDDSVQSLKLTSDGNLLLSGSFNGSFEGMVSNGSSDGFIMKIKN